MSELGQTERNSVRAYVFRVALKLGHCSTQSACLKGAIARNRCAIARCAGSPTASAVTGGKIVKTQNRCALVRSLRRCGLSANMMVADRTVHIRAQDAEGCICIVKNLNDGHPAIGEAEIILTRSLKQFRLDKIEVCCGLQKLVRAMMLQGCRTADRAEVVESGRFATPNSLKSHGERNLLSPLSNPCAITPKLCMLSSPIHPSKNYPASNQRTAAKSP
jgi:hypothetical protein